MNNTNVVSTLYYMHYMIHVHAHVSMHVACRKHTFSNMYEKKMTIYWSKFPEISGEHPFTYPLPLPPMCWSLLGIHFALCSAELRHFFAFHQGVHQRICCRLVGQRGLKVRTILSTTYIMDVSRQKKKRQKNTERCFLPFGDDEHPRSSSHDSSTSICCVTLRWIAFRP